MEKFPVMAWPVGYFDEKQIEEVRLWKEIGLTVGMTSRFDINKHSKDAFIRLLDECRKYDIKVLIQDLRVAWDGAADDPEAYREKYREAYRDFGKHPAALGFVIGDEPMEKQMEDVLAAFKIQLEEAPELLPFLNLLPIWAESNPPYMGFGTLENYISFMKDRYNAPVLSYDRYNQMSNNPEGTEIYFRDMRIYHDLAKTLGIPLWTCLLTIGHWNYELPDEGAVRWQLNTALAGGCTGIIWFTLNDIPYIFNAHGAAINIFGEKTQYFDNIKNVTKFFQVTSADIFKDLTLDECYHVGHAYGGYPLFKPGDSDIVLDVKSLNDVDMILSFFTHRNGDQYVAVVSNSKTINYNNLCITFNSKKCDPYEIRGFGESVRVYSVRPNQSKHDFVPDRDANQTGDDSGSYTINVWAAAGQMYLYRIDSPERQERN